MKAFKQSCGFTLVELLIALLISTIVVAAIYSTYQAQLRSHITQQTLVEMQQNARAALFAMEVRTKHAGFNPQGPDAPHAHLFGFQENFLEVDNVLLTAHASTHIKTDSTHIAFTLDANRNGEIDNSDDELVAYRLNNENLEIYMQDSGGSWQWTAIAQNIEALNFVYLGNDGSIITPPAYINQIQSVQITLIAKSGSGNRPPVMMTNHTNTKSYENQQGTVVLAAQNDHFRRIALRTNVLCRNLNL